jgi:hypothetical protein
MTATQQPPERDGVLDQRVEDGRRDDRHEHAAQRAAQRDEQVEGREVTRARLAARELAIAGHAAGELREGVDADLAEQAGLGPSSRKTGTANEAGREHPAEEPRRYQREASKQRMKESR